MMEQTPLISWKQFQFDNEIYPDIVLIYKSGNNYCSFNKGAMLVVRSCQNHSFVFECLTQCNQNDLLKVTFTSDVFQLLKKEYKVTAIHLKNTRSIDHWRINNHLITDDNYAIWTEILFLEMSHKNVSSKSQDGINSPIDREKRNK